MSKSGNWFTERAKREQAEAENKRLNNIDNLYNATVFRANKAEKQLAEAVEILREVVDRTDDFGWKAREFLAKLNFKPGSIVTIYGIGEEELGNE